MTITVIILVIIAVMVSLTALAIAWFMDHEERIRELEKANKP